MTRWPVSGNNVSTIVSGDPTCCACDQPAERFVMVRWGLGQTSDHPVCAAHLRQYSVDFDGLAPALRRIARQSRAEDVT